MTAAEALHRLKLNLDAQYIGGYVIECSLKALILQATPDGDKPQTLKLITSGAVMHQPEVLLGKLRDLRVTVPEKLSNGSTQSG